jgi:hypothetical protein
LLRFPSIFDADVTIQKYVNVGKARLIKGDALIKDDVKKAWVEAAKGEGEEKVDILLFTVGVSFLLLYFSPLSSDRQYRRQPKV